MAFSLSSQPLMGSARQRKSSGKKMNRPQASEMIRFSTVVKVCAESESLHPFCHCYLKKMHFQI